MEIANDQLIFNDELQTQIHKKKIKGYYLTDNQLVLQIENDAGKIINHSLLFTNQDLAYTDYVTLVNLNAGIVTAPKGYKVQQ